MSEPTLSLSEWFALYGSDKVSLYSYAPLYDFLFEGREQQIQRVLEMGMEDGGSAVALANYFPNATIDVVHPQLSMERVQHVHPRVMYHSIDPIQRNAPQRLSFATYEVILDSTPPGTKRDGSEQVTRFENFCDRLASGGIYVLEEVQDTDVPYVTREVRRLAQPRGYSVVVHDQRSVQHRKDDIVLVVRKP